MGSVLRWIGSVARDVPMQAQSCRRSWGRLKGRSAAVRQVDPERSGKSLQIVSQAICGTVVEQPIHRCLGSGPDR
jgi:hypothetical protein